MIQNDLDTNELFHLLTDQVRDAGAVTLEDLEGFHSRLERATTQESRRQVVLHWLKLLTRRMQAGFRVNT